MFTLTKIIREVDPILNHRGTVLSHNGIALTRNNVFLVHDVFLILASAFFICFIRQSICDNRDEYSQSCYFVTLVQLRQPKYKKYSLDPDRNCGLVERHH